MISISSFNNIEEINRGPRSITYTGKQSPTDKPAIIIYLPFYKLTAADTARLAAEYEQAQLIESDNIAKIYGIEKLRDDSWNGMLIFLEQPAGLTLKLHMQHKKVPLREFLVIATQITNGLAELHKNGILHSEINPSEIMIDPVKRAVKLKNIGFSAINTTKIEYIHSPDFLRNNLPYISPEQTGRTSGNIDYRSDFYSLGMVLYEMLVGSPAFFSNDAMEIIHAHIARQPQTPAEIDAKIPWMLSAIVMKLISKDPHSRYQSARGIMADLEECLSQITNSGVIGPFIPGINDIQDRFILPRKPYGRKNEIEILNAEFERGRQGRARCILVTGPPGIGKSTLINELHEPVLRHKGYYASGKFTSRGREIPYSAIIGAFQGIVQQILSESEERLQIWKAGLLRAVGQNGAIITGIIPEVEILMGRQPEVQHAGPEESQNRFILVFKNFIKLFASKEHPLGLVLEDLEWADVGSLYFLKNLLTDPELSHMIFVGSLCDGSASNQKLPAAWLSFLHRKNIEITEVPLKPLSLADFGEMLSGTLQCAFDACEDLAEIIYQKTGGNPFFMTQFLKSLHESKLLHYDAASGWTWDTSLIRKMKATDNVVELMIERVSRISDESRELLKIAAILGNPFRADSLAEIRRKHIPDIIRGLNELIRNELVLQTPGGYSISHDRILESILSMTGEEEQKRLHYLIGKHLLSRTETRDQHEKIFVIADHFSQCMDLINDENEKKNIIQLSLHAAQKAKSSAAYVSAVKFLACADSLLPGDIWETDYDLAFSIAIELAESEYLAGILTREENRFSELLSKARNNGDKVKIYNLLIVLRIHQDRMEEAVQLGLEACKIFKLSPSKIPNVALAKRKFMKIKGQLDKRTIDDFLSMPALEDPDVLQLMSLLVKITMAIYFFDRPAGPILLYYMTTSLVEMTLKHGNSKYAPYAYSLFGLTTDLWFGDHSSAYTYGKLGMDLVEKSGDMELKSKISYFFGLISFWNRPFNEYINCFSTAFQSGMASGDFMFMDFAILNIYCHSIRKGNEINSLILIYETHVNFIKMTRLENVHIMLYMFYRLVLKLKGVTSDQPPAKFKEIDESMIVKLTNEYKYAQCLHAIANMMSAYIFDDYESALKFSSQIQDYVDRFLFGLIHLVEYYFYLSLSISAQYAFLPAQERKHQLGFLKKCAEKFKKWSDGSPENFMHQYLLIEAEIARISGKDRAAMKYYGLAVKHSRKNGYVNHEAIICERAAGFFLERDSTIAAKSHLSQARNCYREWGADAKLQHLEQKYSVILHDTIPVEDSVANKYLNYATIVNSLQVISSEIIMEDLLKKLMKIALEIAGADRGFFITVDGLNLFVEAETILKDEISTVIDSVPVAEKKDLLLPVVNYVMRLKKYRVIHDARLEENLPLGEYVASHRPLSVLCLPIIRHSRLIGILYLENRIAAGAFTADHIEILELVASQAAISLEIARLYDKLTREIDQHRSMEAALRDSEDRYRMVVESMNEGICVVDDNARINFINTRFCEILGRAREELLGKELVDFLTEKSKPITEQNLMKRRIGDYKPYEIDMVKKDNKLISAIVSPRPIFDADGNFQGSFGLFSDITEKKKMEEDLLKASKIESLGVFAGGIAHDFNNLLTAIIGNISLLRINMPRNDTRYAIIAEAENASMRAKDLTQQLLTFSRGGAPIKKTTSIKKLLHETIDFALSGSNIACGYTVRDDLWNAEIDEGQIAQVFHNLVINAMQAMPGGGGIEAVAANVAVDDGSRLPLKTGNYIKIDIIDHGQGIPPENQIYIFDPYFTTKQNGSGLGLTVSYSIIHRHEGHITFESEIGKGTSFYLYLPASKEQVETEEAMEKKTVLQAGKVLIMDDDEVVLRVAGNMLSHLGLTSDFAAHGEEAIDMYKKAMKEGRPYDLIIMDLTIPGKMGGKEAIVLLKKINKNVKAIVSSGYSNDPVMANYADYGFAGVVAKPYRMEDLQAAIDSVLK